MDMPQLYLITPSLTASSSAFGATLKDALEACDIACVLLRTEARDERERKKIVLDLVPIVQARGAACLVAGDSQLAVRTGADGVHIEGGGADRGGDESLADALAVLHPRGIVGAGGLSTRDAAMNAGEAGADYLMFGGPDSDEPHAGVVERVAWWAEIFNVPCVGFARELSGVPDLVRAGADFIALCDAVFSDPRGGATALREVAAIIAESRESAH
ncbi:thiamine phosphate synthase [Methylocapsa palsarum]|uniref:Thiamine-phosphate pyrophosphorylase n=1 Tax=Methylocapsa palsarum TaxID=1612308 RepID=A0A1I3W3N9_9HYPH|nr:thiamine phosphate synthase [Methylocapsa palsarum]SFK01267.1 thiamine-phosphate pyrophosphorylase [Methylocapsa palsarum]